MIQKINKIALTFFMLTLMFNSFGQKTPIDISDSLLVKLKQDSIARSLLSRHSDSLNGYLNEDLFGIIDTSILSQYPFIQFDQNHYQFYTKESPTFEKLFSKLQEM